jgi:hypothetical protein
VSIELSSLYVDLDFLSPLSDSRANRLVHFLADTVPQVVLDVGFGWAELLMRTLTASPRSLGIGIDRDANAIRHGKGLAANRGLGDRLTLLVGDAAVDGQRTGDAAICVGASQIWDPDFGTGPITEPLDYRRALTAIRGIVRRRGRVVYGEAIWSTTPTPEAIEPLAGRIDEFVQLATLLEIAASCGFAPMAFHEADLDEWDIFEAGMGACYARWLSEHGPDGPAADEVRQTAQGQRTRYLARQQGIGPKPTRDRRGGRVGYAYRPSVRWFEDLDGT